MSTDPQSAQAPQDAEPGATRRVLSGEAWEDFCDTLREAGRVIERMSAEVSDLDRVEWFRYLSRLARNGLERFVENADAARPRLVKNAWRTTMNATNPDQDHFLFELDPGHDYIITGNRGSVPYFIVAVWSWKQPVDAGARNWAACGVVGLEEFNPVIARTTAFIASDDMGIDSAGNFTLHLSQREQAGNWLRLDSANTGMLIRVVYHDRAREQAAQFHICRADGVRAEPLQAAALGLGLARAAQQVLGYAELARVWSQDIFGRQPNLLRFSRELYLANGGVADRHFGFGRWQRDAAEVLLIRFTPPACDYWIFQLCNLWQENLDNYEDGQGYLSKYTARYEPGGEVRIVVADENPGSGGNWVDAYRHHSGLMGLRLIKTLLVPEVSVYRVTLAQWRANGWDGLRPEDAITSQSAA